MYNTCGILQSSQKLFAEMHNLSLSSWNFMIRAYAREGRTQMALHSFGQMQCQGILPDKLTFVHILSACTSHALLIQGKHVHACIVGSGVSSDLGVGNALLKMYGKCRSLKDSWMVFDKMPERNVISWTAVIGAFAQHGEHEHALQLFEQMQGGGVFSDKVTFLSILPACTSRAALVNGKRLHVQILENGFEIDIVVGTTLVSMYGRCGSPENAQRMFTKIPERNVVSWNSMIAVCVKSELGNEAFQFFNQMQQEGVLPDKVTFINSLSACASLAALDEGKKIHIRSLNGEFEHDVVLLTAAINMYGKCGSLEEGRKVFDKMYNRNLISWNAMIGLYAQNRKSKEVFQLFARMQQYGVTPNKVTFVSILDACASQAVLTEGEHVHNCILDMGIKVDVVLGTALVNMYGKCGSLETARSLFDNMPVRNIISWNAMIVAYAQHGQGRAALELFDCMHWEGLLPNKVTFLSILDACACKGLLNQCVHMHVRIIDSGFEADTVLGNALMNIYGKSGRMENAVRVFERLPMSDMDSWRAVISAYVQCGKSNEAFQRYEQMQMIGLMPSKETFVNILEACAHYIVLAKGKQLHACVVDSGLDADMVVATALVNMYGNCGNLQVAWKIFNGVTKKDVVLWTAMIAVHAQHGQGKEAVQLFVQMQSEGVLPNKATFVSILAACSHAGLVDEGCYFFASMTKDYDISTVVDHYDCMIDLLGRAGLLDDAEDLIYRMPFQPTIVSFMALLRACRQEADVERGEHVAEHAVRLYPENTAPYVMLSNVYAAAGRGFDAARVMRRVKDGV